MKLGVDGLSVVITHLVLYRLRLRPDAVVQHALLFRTELLIAEASRPDYAGCDLSWGLMFSHLDRGYFLEIYAIGVGCFCFAPNPRYCTIRVCCRALMPLCSMHYSPGKILLLRKTVD